MAPQTWPAPKGNPPSIKALENAVMRDGLVKATCGKGCRVEVDGSCEHGHPAWTIQLGIC